MKRLGERIKKRREQLKIQLNDLANHVGVSSSALSQIENAKAFPSITTLKKIADNLNITVGEIIGEHETLLKNPIIRHAEMKFVKENDNGAKLYLLSHHDAGKQMEPYLISLPPNTDSSEIINAHLGQEFIHIIKGTIEIVLEDATYLLNPGDNFYLNSNVTHVLKNTSDSITEVIWIISPPNI